MGGNVELIALRSFDHSVGQVDEGQVFLASRTYAKSLVDEGFARRKYDPGEISESKHTRTEVALMRAESNTHRWPGSKVVIVASGPSLLPEDLERIRDWRAPESRRYVIVVNSMFMAAPWADILYGADLAWWRMYAAQSSLGFQGERWTQSEVAARKYGLQLVGCERRNGLSKIPGVIHHGGNSGFQAMGLAAMFGAVDIVLVGFDMQRTGGESHSHGDHPKPLRQHSPFENFLRYFKQLSIDMRKEGIRVRNASRATAILDIDRSSLEEALKP